MCKTWSGRSDLMDELPGRNVCLDRNRRVFGSPHGLLNALESGILSAGETLWHCHDSHIRIDWTETGPNYEFSTR